MTNEEIRKETEQFVMSTYGRQPVAFVRGRGAMLTDADGREYVDFLAGLAVCALGHSHPAVTAAIQQQAAELIHTSNLYLIPNQSKLARYLVDLSFGDKAFFCNSGAEANEGAIKLARRWQEKIGGRPDRKTVLSFENSFHGRTLAALAATGQTKYHDGFAPLPDGFAKAPYNNLEAVRAALDADPAIGAILVETIQAEGGVICATSEFIKGLRALATERGALLIFDEVQTGMGRTGKLFSYEHFGVTPDIMTLAKGLGGGVPIGALVATDKVAAAFTPGSHASTFGGNPLSSAAAVAVFKTMLNDQVPERAGATGKFLMEELEKRRPACVNEIRGRGLLVGIELDRPAAPVVPAMLERGFIVGTAGDQVVRLAPPLIVSQNQCIRVAEVLAEVLK
jgi:acetylornithine aminotransferase/acetylornithine/N-succinyldiaminopimelate aminotransferase